MAPPPLSAPVLLPPLAARLAAALPANLRLIIHHFSAPPTTCDALFAPPPGQSPEPTERENHFLSVAIDHNGAQIQAFATEVFVYATETLTTIFVSKADSTGYLHLLDLPKGMGSPIRTVVSAFLSYLVEYKKRDNVRLVMSLFARAQDQYLFPGSVDNSTKHVLDDRGLIKWWCKILDSILAEYPSVTSCENIKAFPFASTTKHYSRGYITVPGCDSYETRTFIPKASGSSRWIPSDPLRSIGKPAAIPERCLVPRFPDDPKARFVIDLDDELPEVASSPRYPPAHNPQAGKWTSVKSLEQFWEMMAFRQECAAGRLVGFLWGVFEPEMLVGQPFQAAIAQQLTTPLHSQQTGSVPSPPSYSFQSLPSRECSRPKAQSPRFSPTTPVLDPPPVVPVPDDSIPSRVSPVPSELVLTPDAYTRSTDLLMTLDYADAHRAANSTGTFLGAVAKEARVSSWGFEVIGTQVIPQLPFRVLSGSNGDRAVIEEAGMKRKAEESRSTCGVKTLGSGLVRKKPKVKP